METLVKRAMQKDTESFIRLMEEQKQSMLKIAYGFFSNEEDVADVMQQTVLNAFEHIGDLKKPAYFKTRLIRILINNCNQVYSSRKRMVMNTAVADEAYLDCYPEDNAFFTCFPYCAKTTEQFSSSITEKGIQQKKSVRYLR